MIFAQKIRIYPNNKQIASIEKAFGVSRFTYNWILNKFHANSTDFNLFKLKKEFKI